MSDTNGTLLVTEPETLPPVALQLIADVAGQSPLVAQWVSGWLSARVPAQNQQVRLVVDAAHLELTE